MKKIIITVFIVFMTFSGTTLNGLAAEKPQYGGVIKEIFSGGPQVLGYYPEMGPGDHAAAFPAMECMMEMSPERKMVPWLAESVDIDADNLTMTFHIRKGVKFHDGSDLNAEVVAWNYQLLVDTKKLQFYNMIKRIEVVDDYTVVLHLTDYHNQLEYSFGWVAILSKKAYETKGKEWCRTHVVGTGPFEQVEWKRDVSLKWKKFDGYWLEGRPYLDGIEVVYIPDATVASAMMQAGEADMWVTGVSAKYQKELEQKGFIRKSYWSGLPSILTPNTKNPERPTAKLKVREAIEYAINKEAIAKALGYGYYTPLKMMHPEGEWAYDPDWPGRPYNPEKARKLLADAGYPKGLKLKLLAFAAFGGGATAAEAIQAYLGDVGITVDIDLADPGRYFGSMFGSGWDDLLLGFCGIDYNSLGTIQSWYGHSPRTQMASYKQSDRIIALSKESIACKDEACMKEACRKIALELGEQASIIPLFNIPGAYITQPWAHTNYMEEGFVRWETHNMWMEKH